MCIEPIRVDYVEPIVIDTCEIDEMLEKVYKSYRPQLENEAFSLKALLACRSKNGAGFQQMIPAIVEKIYTNPMKDIETALRLIIQIADKMPDAGLNTIYLEVFNKIAKFESKYSLDLPLQKILPL